MLYLLEENRFLDGDITGKMIKAVGFRNLIVHEYGKIELDQVFEVAKKDIYDFAEYLKSIIQKLDIL